MINDVYILHNIGTKRHIRSFRVRIQDNGARMYAKRRATRCCTTRRDAVQLSVSDGAMIISRAPGMSARTK